MDISFILKKAVSLYADKEALVSGAKRFTYREFEERVNRLSGVLRSSGVEKGDRIAILEPNSHEFMEVYFSCAKLGAILCPLNFRLSPKELEFILKDSGAKALISSRRFKDKVAEIKDAPLEKIIWTGEGDVPSLPDSIDYEKSLLSHEPFMDDVEIDEAHIAHLYYTSGTTGVPKGVMLTHKNVCFHALCAIAELNISDGDRWIHVAPMFHLADAWATFAITWVGGTHIFVPDFDPPYVLDVMEKEKVTITNMIPTMLNMLVNVPGVEKRDFSSLRVILSGGAPIAPEVVKRIMEVFKCDYIQTYGMTETSPYLSVSILKDNLKSLSHEEQFVYKAKTGRPFIGVLMKVVRDDGEEVRHDNQEVGEIVVKGDIVTPGYWMREEQTKEAIKDGWLYTGDLAVVDPEGYINIVDRKKDMIITGGENVYSVEVENVLYEHPSVLEAAVIGVPDPKWGEAVKAVVVLKEGYSITEEELIAFCKSRIAHYKAPKSIDFVDHLPKTGSGKIYKKGLRDKYLKSNHGL